MIKAQRGEMKEGEMEMRPGSPTEYVILGALMSGDKHGYELMQFLSSALDSTWRIGTSQLYLLLKRLKAQGFLSSRLESQEIRPSKRVFRITEKGKLAFLNWFKEPTRHVRDLRMEFLCKLFFLDHLGLEGGEGLVNRQVAVLERLLGKIKENPLKDEGRFMRLVYGFKVRNVEAMLLWLSQDVMPLMVERPENRKA
jgi:DNA-binding PadR family transcriptional regulator